MIIRDIITESYGSNESVCLENTSILLTETVRAELNNDQNLMEAYCLLESFKINNTLKNFFKSSEDYKNIKSELREIIEFANLPKEQVTVSLATKALHVGIRILQICSDGLYFENIGTGTKALSKFAKAMLIASAGNVAFTLANVLAAIVPFVSIIMLNRCIRALLDMAEVSVAKKEINNTRKVMKEMLKNATENGDEATANKMKEALEKLDALEEKAKE